MWYSQTMKTNNKRDLSYPTNLRSLAAKFSCSVMVGNHDPSSRRRSRNYSPTHGDDPANRQGQ